MSEILVEAYVTSPAQALAAEDAGAGRIELCGPGEGGLTPTREAILETLSLVRVPVHVMVRPREGDFHYSAHEFDAMRLSVEMVKRSGAAGVVFGVLRREGMLDNDRMSQLVALARPLRVACHRAFDSTPDADAALETLLRLGVDVVLTSGHAPTALEGAATLARHVAASSGRIEILAGGSVRAHNVQAVVAASGVRSVHARGLDPAEIRTLAAALRSIA